jgi:hypothetical protein
MRQVLAWAMDRDPVVAMRLAGTPVMMYALIGAGDLATAESACTAAMAQCRDTGDVNTLPPPRRPDPPGPDRGLGLASSFLPLRSGGTRPRCPWVI